MLFVLGSGRSGTHWLGHILDAHPDVESDIEPKGRFQLTTQAALRAPARPILLPIVRAAYTLRRRSVRPGAVLADKCHPVIWYAEDLARWFPEAKFLAIHRSPFGTVSSMLRHDGVLRWQRQWHKYGVPNEFLGITESNRELYADASPAGKAAYRWRSHTERLCMLRKLLGPDQFTTINYDHLSQNFEVEVARLFNFAGLEPFDASSTAPVAESLYAWRGRLTEGEQAEIADISGIESSVDYGKLTLENLAMRLGF